jgi:hypothetical protein
MRYRWDPAYPGSTRRTGPDEGLGLRVSDAERNEVAEKLSRHFGDGRLAETEFKTRLDRALGAVTRGDLDGLFHDLPRLTDDPAPPTPHRRRFLPVAVLAVVAAVVAGAVASTIHVTWVLIVLVGLFVWHRAGRRRSFASHSGDVRPYEGPQ